jgi:hypothetical protein
MREEGKAFYKLIYNTRGGNLQTKKVKEAKS